MPILNLEGSLAPPKQDADQINRETSTITHATEAAPEQPAALVPATGARYRRQMSAVKCARQSWESAFVAANANQALSCGDRSD
jgi:hypothetical protein